MKTTDEFMLWLCSFFEFGGVAPYNKTQVDEISDWLDQFVKTEFGRIKLKETLRRTYKARPLLSEIADEWNFINIDEPEIMNMITEGKAADIYKRIHGIREKQMTGYCCPPSEVSYLAKWSRLEAIMGDLYEEGRTDEAERAGEFIKDQIELGNKIPIIDSIKIKSIVPYLRKAVENTNANKK